ncbi:hypothetical protein O3P69_019031 [Scylla paramamosain]|uniref:Uncharacterized protein n=1 Tax=Scylla paramamosain TaxID=85552 RepID=A0AAW0T9H6_SCYPA
MDATAGIHEEENSQIINAVDDGDIAQFREALARGCDPHVTVKTTRGSSSCLLAVAASRNHVSLLPHLVELGLDLEGIDPTGRTPLMEAAIFGQTSAVKMLLELGADPLKADKNLGCTALHLAALWGHEETVAVLSQVTPVTVLDHDGRTPMHVASEAGQVGVLKQMNSLGWSYHSEDKEGRTLLHWAVYGRELDTVRHLVLVARLDPLKKDVEGNSPLMWSVLFGYHTIENWLIKQSGILSLNISQTLELMKLRSEYDENAYYRIILDVVKGNLANLNNLLPESRDGHLTDESGRTPLHWAAELGLLNVVEKMLDQGLNAGVVTYSGLTPADLAYQAGHVLIGQVLEHEQWLQEELSAEELYGSLLLAISEKDDVMKVSQLLHAGCPIEPTGSLSLTALQLAISLDRRKIVNLLLARGAALTSTLNGLNLLQQAWRSPDVTPGILSVLTRAYSRRLQVEKTQLKHCGPEVVESIDLIVSCIEGSTPWKAHWPGSKTVDHTLLSSLMTEAARTNCPITATFLQQAGAWPFFSGLQATSPLHAALKAGHWGMVDMLVRDLGGCVYVPDREGCLPIDLIPQEQQQQLEKRLYENERGRLENLEIREKDESGKQDVRKVLRLQKALFTRYTQDRKRKRAPAAGVIGLLLGSRYGLLQLVHLLLQMTLV